MPREDLIRLLGEKFQQFKFWPLKSLKHETKQPEAFLKEVLSEIGYLAREGPAANKWGLKYEYAATLNVAYVTESDVKADNIAKEEEFDDEDEEDEEMEDVKIEPR
jgi:transcription initiation factor TFIIF subunit beta